MCDKSVLDKLKLEHPSPLLAGAAFNVRVWHTLQVVEVALSWLDSDV